MAITKRRAGLAISLVGLSLWVAAPPRVGARPAQALLAANGTTLTVTTSHSVATFARADLVGFTNTLTGETYLRNPSAGQLATVDTVTNTGQALQASNWTIAPEPGTGVPVATITLSDASRTFVVTVREDPVSEEIVVRTNATTSLPGLRGASWSLAGLDLSAGRLIVPARTGQVLDASYPGIGTAFDYPDNWNAQMLVYEAAAGSIVLYSTDTAWSFKRLRVSTRGNTTIDVAIGTEAAGPYASATTTPQVEWRLKAFAGDWQVAASVYRTWLNASHPPLSIAAYPWVSGIRAVVTVLGLDTAMLAPLANVLVPSQTLLYVVQWRADEYDVDYPDYAPAPGAAAFVSAAKALGFRVMLHTDLIGVSPGNPDYPSVQAFHVRHPDTLQLMGWKWEEPPSTPQRFAYISPASSAFRALWIARVGAAVAALQPDALHLDISSPTYNDGNGIIEGRNYPAGLVRFHEDIRAAFPSLALGGEGENDVLYPYHAFAQVLTYTAPDHDPPPGHPITAFLFAPSVQFYGHLGMPKPAEAEFKRWFFDTITRGSAPALRVDNPADVDTTNTEIARMVAFLQNWQTHRYQLAMGDWQGDLARWDGTDATTASLTDQPNLLTVTAAGSTLVQMAHQANRVVTPRFSPGWPAFDSTTLYGLDPERRYWLDAAPRPVATHVTSLPLGVTVDASTLISTRFAHVALTRVASATFDATLSLLYGQTGVRFQNVDTPLGNGAVVQLASITAGGVTRSGLFIHPPYLGQVGGETFIEYQVPLPHAAALQFGVGVADNAACTDGVTFRVSVNGAVIWSQHVTPTGWQDVTLSLAAYANTTAALRLTSHPGPANNPGCDWALWSPARVEAGPTAQAILVPLVLGPGAVFSGYDGSGLATVVSPSAVNVANLLVPGWFTLFTEPGSAVAAGTSLTSVPFETWLRDHGELARLGSIFGSGTVTAGTAGGVFKIPTVGAHPPYGGQTVLTWVLQLPAAAPLRLGWSAGILDGGATVDGVDFEVRINGASYWRLTTSANAWTPDGLDLTSWQGRPILLELVTDSRATNNFDWAQWADLTLTTMGAACGYSVPAGTAVGSAGGPGAFSVTTPSGCPWLAMSNQPWLVVAPPASGNGTATLPYSVAPNAGGPRSGVISVAGQTFTVTQGAGSADLVQNGGFDAGLSGWQTFATPDLSYLVASVAGGVLEFYRQPPPPGTTNQATVFQNTGVPVGVGGGLEARFDLGNSSSVRKRISVLILESDFSDLSVCAFWLGPNAPLRAYRMRTHTTEAWTNASIYFYAASAGANGGAYQLDNVSLHEDPAVSTERTECVDPTAPAATSGVDGPSLLSNGDFGAGLAPWGLFGQIVQQIAGGVFEFYRPAGTPAGVVLQNTGQPAAANEILTATLELGNSSAVKKRVTILLHDNDFTDLMACTFWLPPGVPLSPHAVRGFATKAWTAGTVSVYPATVGAEQWIRLDNVALRRTPSAAVIGVECLEPGAAALLPPPNATSTSGANGAPVVAAAAAAPAAVRPPAGRPLPDGEASEVRVLERIDLRDATRAQVTVRSWLPAGASGVEVQVSRDGVTWLTVAVLIGSDDWASWIIDLQDFLGEVIRIRLVFPRDSSA